MLNAKSHKSPITFNEFDSITNSNTYIKKVLENQLVIPEFDKFRDNFVACFHEIKEDRENRWSGGVVADYIPPLAKANPKWFASAFCSTDG
jgi:hypothetical protein